MIALNSIKDSLVQNMKSMGLSAVVMTSANAQDVVASTEVKIILLGPELLKLRSVVQALLSVRETFVIKCVDEAHLFMAWGVETKKGKHFRPAMKLSTGELSTLGET